MDQVDQIVDTEQDLKSEPVFLEIDSFQKEEDQRIALEQHVEETKMQLVLSSCVAYCVSMTVVCGIFAYNNLHFQGEGTQLPSDCFAVDQLNTSVDRNTSGAVNVSANMVSCMKLGFGVHFLGMFADSSMVIRVKCRNKNFGFGALLAVSVYTFVFVAWLIWIHVLRYNNNGKMCSGYYLDSSIKFVQDGYAIRQGQVLQNIIIGVWCANTAIGVVAVIADAVGKQYLQIKKKIKVPS